MNIVYVTVLWVLCLQVEALEGPKSYAERLAEIQGVWWSSLEERLVAHLESEDGGLQLDVELYCPKEGEAVALKDQEGSVTGYTWRGEKLSSRFWQGETLLMKFDFVWQGVQVQIPDGLWKEEVGFRLNEPKLKVREVAEEFRDEFEQFLTQLRKPRLVHSLDGLTAMIEWERGEECDGASVFRWIVTRDGKVTRHIDGFIFQE